MPVVPTKSSSPCKVGKRKPIAVNFGSLKTPQKNSKFFLTIK